MKNVCLNFVIMVITTIMVAMGCSGDPVSYVDGYSVKLTEDSGTEYTGNYFPLLENYTLNYSGFMSMKTKLVFSGETIEDNTNAPVIGMLKVLALQNIPLSSGTIPLYPIVDLSSIAGEIVADTSRFFMKDSQAVYVKALAMSDGSYLEVENPIYIKSKLVVGDSWDTAPKLDMTKLLVSEFSGNGIQSNITLHARAKFFVVGNEDVSLPNGTQKAMRLEQANDIAMSGTITQFGQTINMNMTAKLGIVYHLIADIGIVQQNVTGPLAMNISADGETATITIDINDCVD